jgi:hypothetical protein
VFNAPRAVVAGTLAKRAWLACMSSIAASCRRPFENTAPFVNV